MASGVDWKLLGVDCELGTAHQEEVWLPQGEGAWYLQVVFLADACFLLGLPHAGRKTVDQTANRAYGGHESRQQRSVQKRTPSCRCQPLPCSE